MFNQIFIVLFVGVLSSAYALECYSCDSRWQAACAAPFNETAFTPVNCTAINSLQDACAVYTATVSNQTYTTRACTSTVAGQPCNVYKSVVEALNGTLEECRSCQSDRCNTAADLRGVFFTVIALVGVLQLFLK